MFLFSSTTMAAFLLASPVFSMPTTPNDPFQALAIYAQKQHDLPICCLTPPSAVEPVVEDDVLLSFEEWKAKQFAIQAEAKAKAKDTSRSAAATSQSHVTGNNQGEHSSETLAADVLASPGSSSPESEGSIATELLSPHFRVPLTDRFNYASLDCSARVHTAHRSAKSPSSILSSKKDKYMLSPCGTSKGQTHFVVVELCEDIRIDTVQLANFEFFSGVFKDFTVSVAKTYTTDAGGWTVAGTYKAKNVRGVQSFHPPTSLRDFYRYIRIEFHSHYSNEYYCPISLLRVYGLTHLEQWKWDIWEAESRAKQDELEETEAAPHVDVVGIEFAQSTPGLATQVSGTNETADTHVSVTDKTGHGPTNTTREDTENFMDSLKENTATSSRPNGATDMRGDHQSVTSDPDTASSTVADSASLSEALRNSPISERNAPVVDGSTSSENYDSTTYEISRQISKTDSFSEVVTPIAPTDDSTSPSYPSPSNVSGVQQSPLSHQSTTIINTLTPSASPTATPSIPHLQLPVAASAMGGESIYRTIMNRLTALEANHTLYARYVEEQTAGVRDMLKRLGEEVGRLEGIGKAQAQMYQRTITEWERQRNRLEMEHGELLSRVDYLSDEIVLEKRLGIAQLCLLLAVLVFMGLTRGSRGESLLEHSHTTAKLNKSMREWSRRHLSFASSDWANRFRSRSPTPQPVTRSPQPGNDKVAFPSSETPPPYPTSRPPLPTEQGRQINGMDAFTSERWPPIVPLARSGDKRSRTPTSLRTPTRLLSGHHRPVTPTGTRSIANQPPVQRANSHGAAGMTSPGFSGIGPVPRSAKRWARSAHLHEVRGKGDREKGGGSSRDQTRTRDRRGRENDSGEVFMSPSSPLKGYSSTRPIGVSDALQLIDKKGKSPQVFSTHRMPLSPLPKRLPLDTDDSTEYDAWIDTDADGSDLYSESEFQYSPKVKQADP